MNFDGPTSLQVRGGTIIVAIVLDDNGLGCAASPFNIILVMNFDMLLAAWPQ